ncbi:TPA: MacB family efflux pump subunit [Escherichia coli]|uniref:Pyoverdine export ATP-binding/permease protein PvdT n=3 Tax=Escherichia coli TaxID=562 RepID=A0A138KU32_ECOLX|nr:MULTISPECIES: MacB family efflux pump subunit [Enterobacteriaceae]EEY7561241.1 MacB family efflux pump subunit [Escherichia coli O2]EEZ5714064.1 MacB family efflux pump subunit [Escherichia coli O25]EFA5403955.1 MacB family efflux pump subunit [Escherichia coli O109]EFA5480360.1 MacB family efflux pump subunit [Escherichia coli O8]EFA8772564.1 MacB family efflux pump subunit [Escherichia coli O25:H4]EFZ2351247.1 MacB family efflux pump subunit [Shigella sonnei]EGO9530323.1 MacB family eff
MKKLIELKGVSRTYGNGDQTRTVLKNVDLTIVAGEMVAIIGASGSGKSTLMNIMGCLDVPNRGDYYIDGQNAACLSPDELARVRREHIGFIFQRYHLIPDLSALGNVEIPAIYANSERDSRRQRATALLGRLGLEGREHHKPCELSGGQQQRVSIARALINGGKIILADEPTGALDSQSGQEVLAILNELNRRGHTVVMVTHDMKVARHAKRIIELCDGEIIADSGGCVSATETLPQTNSIRQSYWKTLLDRTRESMQMALKAMKTHRLRTTLTMIGIVFGIASVVTVVALGEGARQETLEEIKSLGTNVVSIYPGQDLFDDSIESIRTLVPADANALAKQGFIDSVSPEVSASDNIRFLGKSAIASINGVGREHFRVKGIELLQGTTFRDDRNALQEVIIDENTRKAIFDNTGLQALGQIVFLGSVPARVVGIAKSNNRSDASNRITVWMPYSTVMYRIVGKPVLTGISVRLKDNVDNEAAISAISQLLTRRHGIKDFQLYNFEQIRKSIEHTSMTFSILILMVACISLMIGSIGVMNIMLISVTERTHEIGVRMAVGARRSDIMQQFIIEAVLVCLIGGALGIALSYITGALFNALADGIFAAIYSWQAAVAAFFCSTLIGIIFGYLPARKAARMDPVISLASE